MAEETKAILKLADEYVPDITIHLHGGGNSPNQFYQFDYMPRGEKEKCQALADSLQVKCYDKGYVRKHYFAPKVAGGEDTYKNCPPSFNIQGAWVNICGEPCLIYESNQGLYYEEDRWGADICHDFDTIYDLHRLLFEETFNFVKRSNADAQ